MGKRSSSSGERIAAAAASGVVIALAGAATAAAHTLGAWLLTPFFGGSAWFWSHAAGSPALAIGIGIVAGRLAAGKGDVRPKAPLVLGALGAALIAALPLTAPPIARAILDSGPDARMAAPFAIVLAISLPCGLASSVLRAGAAGAEGSMRPLAIFVGGAIAAIVAEEPLLLDPGATPPWYGLWAAGGALALACGLSVGPRAALLLTLLAAAPVGEFWRGVPEASTTAFRDALGRGWSLRAGRYYLETAPEHVLKESELIRHWKDFQGAYARAREGDAAVLAFVDALRHIGRAKMSGDGLRYVCDRTMAPVTRARLAPLLDRVVEVTSDGRGGFDATVATDPDAEVATVLIQGQDGSDTRLEVGKHVTVSLRDERSPDATRACLDMGPLVVEAAGALERNDTHRTPVLVKNAKLFFDAYLLGIDFEATRTRVSVKVRAQGSIGPIQEKEISSEERGTPAAR